MSAGQDPFLLELFRTELETHARALETGLAAAGTPNANLEPLMRAAHSIKGAARMTGIDPVVTLAHAMEDAFSAAMKGEAALHAGRVRALTEATSLLLSLAALAPEAIPDEAAARAAEMERLASAVASAEERAEASAPAVQPELAMQVTADLPLLELFRTELETQARALETGLIAIEGETSPAAIEPMMRAAHSVKGAARMAGLDPVVTLAHAMEDVLSAAQHGRRVLGSQEIDLLLRANDVFLALAAAPPDRLARAVAGQSARIQAIAAEIAAAPPTAPPPPQERADSTILDLFRAELATHVDVLERELATADAGLTEDRLEPLMRAAHSIKGAIRMAGLEGAVGLADAAEDVFSAARQGKRKLGAAEVAVLREAVAAYRALCELAPEEIPAGIEARRQAFDRLAARLTQGERSVEEAPAAAASATPHERASDGYVRVFAENLDRLVGLAGECLVQAETLKVLQAGLRRLEQCHAALTRKLAVNGSPPDGIEELDDLIRVHSSAFTDYAHRIEQLTARLYHEAVATRMRPLSDALHGYPRMIRDLARNMGKEVRFEVEGRATQVDREILEKLEAPLTHLLRNAVDHGIEDPARRLAAGKPAEGRIVLSAHHRSGLLNITVSDDGAGIDSEELRRKVVERGYAPAEMAAGLTEAELLEFLFLPGFTTRGAVSEVSGRGVGLDIVHSMAREVGGSVRVESRRGEGTAFHLLLPLTVSVVRALLFEISGETYAIPFTRIDRCLRVPLEEVRTVEDRQYCTVDGAHVGIVEATQALGLPPVPRESRVLNTIIISDRLTRYGLVVDRFCGQRELVVVPLDRRLGKLQNISAGAVLQDGSPVLILDTEDLVRSIDKLLSAGGLQKLRAGVEQSGPKRKRVLVVDDSLTVREVERRLLENGGYDVTVAVDGMDGWNALRSGNFDLLLTDVDMPRMDGFELVRRVRAAPQTSSLPVIIVSYKDQEEYRIKGLEAGANAYLTKGSFHGEGLLKTVRDLIGEA
ncbi:MAG TPA: Hpt domain-containing protein [Bryobacteraceae bacterium]|nr:Hpt domain-containing protein [Bryobacteraceae bacterium]HPU73760.1 Hpt domain-containing protein [Bryobacteraceae bacterium]